MPFYSAGFCVDGTNELRDTRAAALGGHSAEARATPSPGGQVREGRQEPGGRGRADVGAPGSRTRGWPTRTGSGRLGQEVQQAQR